MDSESAIRVAADILEARCAWAFLRALWVEGVRKTVLREVKLSMWIQVLLQDMWCTIYQLHQFLSDIRDVN